MFPNVSFTLQDDSKSRENDSSKGHVLRVPKVRDISMYMISRWTVGLTDSLDFGCLSTHVWSCTDRGENIFSSSPSITYNRLVIACRRGQRHVGGFESGRIYITCWSTFEGETASLHVNFYYSSNIIDSSIFVWACSEHDCSIRWVYRPRY